MKLAIGGEIKTDTGRFRTPFEGVLRENRDQVHVGGKRCALNQPPISKLAGPTRRAIFERLCERGEVTVHALTEFSGVSQPAVSKHLGVLKLAGLVRDRQAGREKHYSMGIVPLIDWLAIYSAFWHDRFDRLEDLLKRMDQ